jgi:hypothetical protein
MLNRFDIRILLSTCLLSSLMTACGAPSDIGVDPGDEEADGVAVQALSTDETVKSLEPIDQLAREWMRWAMEMPYSTGPIADTTGDDCAMGQEGPVWFLAGTYGGPVTRHCTIPAGKELYFPLINRWFVFFPEYYPHPNSIHEFKPELLAWFKDQLMHTCTLTLRVDGVEVAGGFDEMLENQYVLVPDPFEVYLNPEDSFVTKYGLSGGEMLSAGDGHYARLKALSPGDHVVELGGSACDGDTVWFETSATYYLHIEE